MPSPNPSRQAPYRSHAHRLLTKLYTVSCQFERQQLSAPSLRWALANLRQGKYLRCRRYGRPWQLYTMCRREDSSRLGIADRLSVEVLPNKHATVSFMVCEERSISTPLHLLFRQSFTLKCSTSFPPGRSSAKLKMRPHGWLTTAGTALAWFPAEKLPAGRPLNDSHRH